MYSCTSARKKLFLFENQSFFYVTLFCKKNMFFLFMMLVV